MPKLQFTEEELRGYFNEETTSHFYKQAVEMEDAFAVHADGVYPESLIEEARPNESEEVRNYRKKIYKNKTKPTITKVFNSLSKIRRSADWAVNYPAETFSRIPEDETLEVYCEEKFPYFKSITNWVFQELLRKYLKDPNAVCVVLPKEIPEQATTFLEPVPLCYHSKFVLDFKQDDYVVIKNPLGSVYYDDSGYAHDGKSFTIVTTQTIFIYDQVDDKENYILSFRYNHNLGLLPAYRIGAILIGVAETDFLYESRIASMLPSLDEAAREYSDLQAGVISHLYLERWEIATTDCQTCNGSGRVKSPAISTSMIECTDCHGSGSRPSPYNRLIVKKDALDVSSGYPIPPAGYLDKNTGILELQEKRIEKHFYDALASVNMEFLAKTPMAESGIAKEVDRDETNNFVHSVGEDLVRVMDWLYYVVAKYRYGFQYPDDNDIKAMLPDIPVPEHFDIFSTKFAEEELKNAKENKFNPVLISAMEESYASKKFNETPELQDRVALILRLDPLANLTEDDKTLRLQNKGITQLDYVISSNIVSFVSRALDEENGFAEKERSDQLEIITKYAEEVIKSNSEAEQLKTEIFSEDGTVQEGEPRDPNEPVNNSGDDQQELEEE